MFQRKIFKYFYMIIIYVMPVILLLKELDNKNFLGKQLFLWDKYINDINVYYFIVLLEKK